MGTIRQHMMKRLPLADNLVVHPTDISVIDESSDVLLIGDTSESATGKTTISSFLAACTSVIRTTGVNDFAANQSMGGFKLTSVGTCTDTTDAANKAYVDAVIAGLAPKESVRAATTTAGTLATDFDNGKVIDGVTLATGDRILIQDQVAQAENGIYIVAASGAPTRATDADSSGDLVGAYCMVEEGTANADQGFICTADSPIVVNTTALPWVHYTSTAISAGYGLAKTGNTLAVEGSEITAAVVDVANDAVCIIDADDSSAMRAESVADLATGMAANGLAATSGTIAVKADTSTGGNIQAVNVAANGTGLDVSAIAGTGIEADGSANLRLAAQGNGIAGGAGSTLSVNADVTTGGNIQAVNVAANGVGLDISAIAGTGIEADGSGNLRLAAQGNGIAGGAGSTLSVNPDVTTGGNVVPVDVTANGVGLDVDDINGTGLEADGAGLLRLAAQGNGIAGGAGSTLSVNADVTTGGNIQAVNVAANGVGLDISAIAGTGIEADGSANLRLAAQGNGIGGGAGSTLSVTSDVTTGGNTVGVAVSANGVGLDVSGIVDGSTVEADGAGNVQVKSSGITSTQLSAGSYAPDAIVWVKRGATGAASGTNFKTAYTTAKSLTPGGNALSETNRAAVVFFGGDYDFGSTALDVDTEYVDFIGIGTGVARFNRTASEYVYPQARLICDTDTEVILQTARSVHMHGFTIVQETDAAANKGLVIQEASNHADKSVYTDIAIVMPGATRLGIDDGTDSEIAACFENVHVQGVAYQAAAGSGTISGTWKNCTATGNYSFVGAADTGGTISGRMENVYCPGDVAFASGESTAGGTISGKLIRCECYDRGFASSSTGTGGTISGTMEHCYAESTGYCAGTTGGEISGVVEHCYGNGAQNFCCGGTTGGTISGLVQYCHAPAWHNFAYGTTGGTISGTVRNCYVGDYAECFASGTTGGTISGSVAYCVAGDDSFGSGNTTDGTISGTIEDCQGGDGSFCNSGATASKTGRLVRCRTLAATAPVTGTYQLVQDCTFHVDSGTSNTDAISLVPLTVGTSQTDSNMANSDTSHICIQDTDVTAQFPVGSMVKNTTDGSWHRVTSSVMGDGGDADGNDDTVVTVTPAAAVTQFDGLTVQAYHPPIIDGCTLISTGTGNCVDASAETPCVIVDCKVNAAAAGNAKWYEDSLPAAFTNQNRVNTGIYIA